jgi:hypothetical protein
MKINKLILAAAFGLGAVSLCEAGTIYMTGSTAMRSSIFTTITHAGSVFTAVPVTTTYEGSSPSGANYMVFSGTLVGGSGTTVLKCHWSGSEGGIKDVATSAIEQFVDDSIVDGANHTASPGTTIGHTADLAMADTSQAFSRNKTPTLTTGAKVAVITFTWVRNQGLWTGSNLTDSMIRQALGGFCKRAVFSGNAADVNDYVYVSGRDNQSGTRVNQFGISGFGIFTPPNQIEMDSSGNMLDLDPPNGTYAGDFGFSSGGTLAGTLGANTTTKSDLWNGGTGYSVVSFLSRSDANTAIANGAIEISADGVVQSAAAVKEGTYVYWGNEYIYQKNGASSEAQSVYNNMVVSIPNDVNGTTAIKLSDMNCTRSGPTSDPAHN